MKETQRKRTKIRKLKFFTSDSFAKAFLSSLLIIIIVSLVVGFIMDPRDFLGNFLAEIAGIAIAILIGFLFVDKFVEHCKKLEWAKVRNLTLRAITAHLCDIASNFYIYFPIHDHRSMGVILEGRDCPSQNTIKGFKTLLNQLKSIKDSGDPEKSTSDISIEFYNAVKWDIDQIQSILTPRVIQSSGEQPLIDALIAFDDAHRELRNSIIAHKLVSTHSVFPNIILLVKRSGQLYKALFNYWN